MAEKIINLKHKNFLPQEDEELFRISKYNRFRYQYYSFVAYNNISLNAENYVDPSALDKSFNDLAPFSLYKSGIPITILKQYTSSKIDKIKLQSAREAFKELENFAEQCCERISADLCCQVILHEVMNRKDNDLIIFIEKSASDKMLGRLATLQLDLNSIIICFLTYKPSGLMTIAMSSQTSKLRFDINRLMTSDSVDFKGPYPGDSEDSLIQAYFYQPAPRGRNGEAFSPMRFDIFSQGLRMDQVESKKESIKEIFLNRTTSYKDPYDDSALPRLIPKGFEHLDGKLKELQKKVKDQIHES